MHDVYESPDSTLSGPSCILRCSGIRKRYGSNTVLENVAFHANAGSLTSIVGPSGCGKSTLLALLGGLDTSYEGLIEAAGLSLNDASEAELDQYRRQEVGFIFQDFNLIEHMTVLENVVVALEIDGLPRAECIHLAKRSLERVGLADKFSRYSNELSGGEVQRVAIARAIAKRPPIILADEPTGSLDARTAKEIAHALRQLADEGACVVVVTHDIRLFASLSDETVELRPVQEWEGEEDPVVSDGPSLQNSPGFAKELSAIRDKNTSAGAKDAILTDPSSVDEPRGAKSGSPNDRYKLSFGVLMRMAFSHMRARMKRVAGAIAVCGVGMLGFGLLLSLLFGTYDYASDLQSRILANIPVTITRDISLNAEASTSVDDVRASQRIPADGSLDDVIEQMVLFKSGNVLAGMAKILEMMQEEQPDILSVQSVYPLTNDVYVRTADGWRFLDAWTFYEDVMTTADGDSLVTQTLVDEMPAADLMFRPLISSDEAVLERKYDLLGGHIPTSSDEVVIVTRPDGSLGDIVLALLGYVDTDALLDVVEDRLGEKGDSENGELQSVSYARDVSLDELLSLDLAVLQSCDYRIWNGDMWVNAWYERSYMEEAIAHGTELKVVGVVAPRYSMEDIYDSGYVAYLPGLEEEMVEHADVSPVVIAQRANPDINVETNELFSQEKDLAARILAQVDTSGLESKKIDYLRNLSNVRTRALLRSEGMDEREITPAMIAQIDDWLDEARNVTYEKFVSSIESVAPASLDDGIGAVLTQFDAYSPESIQEVRVYVDSLAEWQHVVEKTEEYNDLRKENGLDGVSVAYAGEVILFRQAMQIMFFVVIAFALMSVAVILVSMSSTMRTFVAERMREIGCLRSMGMGRDAIGWLFVIEAIVMGIIAVAVSAIVVAIAVAILNVRMEEIMGGTSMFKFDLLTVMAMLIASIVLCALAGAIPARNAAHKDPVAALRL